MIGLGFDEAKEMARGTLKLRSRELIEKYGGDKTLYRISKDGDANYTTLLRWKDAPESVQAVKLDVLFSFLCGLGLSGSDIEALPLGEIFNIELDSGAAE